MPRQIPITFLLHILESVDFARTRFLPGHKIAGFFEIPAFLGRIQETNISAKKEKEREGMTHPHFLGADSSPRSGGVNGIPDGGNSRDWVEEFRSLMCFLFPSRTSLTTLEIGATYTFPIWKKENLRIFGKDEFTVYWLGFSSTLPFSGRILHASWHELVGQLFRDYWSILISSLHALFLILIREIDKLLTCPIAPRTYIHRFRITISEKGNLYLENWISGAKVVSEIVLVYRQGKSIEDLSSQEKDHGELEAKVEGCPDVICESAIRQWPQNSRQESDFVLIK